jgi:orotate phosphoribosyltransferase-like protein
MSAMKRLIENILELYEEGVSVTMIAKSLGIDREMVESVVEEYSE